MLSITPVALIKKSIVSGEYGVGKNIFGKLKNPDRAVNACDPISQMGSKIQQAITTASKYTSPRVMTARRCAALRVWLASDEFVFCAMI